MLNKNKLILPIVIVFLVMSVYLIIKFDSGYQEYNDGRIVFRKHIAIDSSDFNVINITTNINTTAFMLTKYPNSRIYVISGAVNESHNDFSNNLFITQTNNVNQITNDTRYEYMKSNGTENGFEYYDRSAYYMHEGKTFYYGLFIMFDNKSNAAVTLSYSDYNKNDFDSLRTYVKAVVNSVRFIN